jgi:hypothetical protein
VAHSSATWYVAVVSAEMWAYKNTKLNVKVSVIEHMQHDEYRVLSKQQKAVPGSYSQQLRRR